MRAAALRPLTCDAPPVGGAARAAPCLDDLTLEPGDALVLCSHPIRATLSTGRVEWLTGAGLEPREACCDLATAARAAGVILDATAIVAHFDAAPCPVAPTADPILAATTIEWKEHVGTRPFSRRALAAHGERRS